MGQNKTFWQFLVGLLLVVIVILFLTPVGAAVMKVVAASFGVALVLVPYILAAFIGWFLMKWLLSFEKIGDLWRFVAVLLSAFVYGYLATMMVPFLPSVLYSEGISLGFVWFASGLFLFLFAIIKAQLS